MMITKSPVQNSSPWIYAVLPARDECMYDRDITDAPKPKLTGTRFQNLRRAFSRAMARTTQTRTILSSPYTFASSLATSWVPSGLASSTTIISHASSLDPLAALFTLARKTRHALLAEYFGQQPDDDGQILALVVGGQDDRVLVGIRGGVLALHVQGGSTLKRIHSRAGRDGE